MPNKKIEGLLIILNNENTDPELYRKTELQLGFLLINNNTTSLDYTDINIKECERLGLILRDLIAAKSLEKKHSAALQNIYIKGYITIDELVDLLCYEPWNPTESLKRLLSKNLLKQEVKDYLNKIERASERLANSEYKELAPPTKKEGLSHELYKRYSKLNSNRTHSTEVAKLTAKGVNKEVAEYLSKYISYRLEELRHYLYLVYNRGEPNYTNSLGNNVTSENMNELCIDLINHLKN
jgi:hypothetical protein